MNVPAFSKPVLLHGREHMNRSVHGDIVVVEVFPESEWKAAADEVVDQDGKTPVLYTSGLVTDELHLAALKNDDAEDSEEDVGGEKLEETKLLRKEKLLARNTSTKSPLEKQPTGKVVGVIKRNWRAYVTVFSCIFALSDHSALRYVCHIDRTSLSNSSAHSLSVQTVFATPVSRLLPRIRLRTRQAPTLLSQKILVTIDHWSATSRYPEGHFVRALGQVESKEAEQESLLLEFEVPYRPFGKAVLDCLPPEGDKWVVPVKGAANPEWRDREDLRDLLICSIDPPSVFFLYLVLSRL